MNTTIWKFRLLVRDYDTIQMPAGANIISVDVQHGEVCLWAEVDPGAAPQPRHFALVPTGGQLPRRNLEHLGTVLISSGNFVLHIYELTSGA
jgi:hypothetical protein